jgi:hypothetical protein
MEAIWAFSYDSVVVVVVDENKEMVSLNDGKREMGK